MARPSTAPAGIALSPEFHQVMVTKGQARLRHEDQVTPVSAGDRVHQRPGTVHYLSDCLPDMEYLEVGGPADFGTVETEGPCAVPAPMPWK